MVLCGSGKNKRDKRGSHSRPGGESDVEDSQKRSKSLERKNSESRTSWFSRSDKKNKNNKNSFGNKYKAEGADGESSSLSNGEVQLWGVCEDMALLN